ncbi:hypothetical protein ACO0LL_24190 [Undibacterium sp. TC4M20W]|uniref:hypothetical protein n=1 Tax=Undibacterium sp. TC4M20W TaxID=3413052 RepID=UPI003BF1AAFA
MIYFLLAILVLILVSILGGFIYVYKKISRRYFVLLALTVIGGPYIAFKLYEHQFMLEAVPDALGVNSISYNKEESWGFGPGGNEAGIRLYPMPENTSQDIKKRGMEFFRGMPENKNQQSRSSRGHYEDWAVTPIKPTYRWAVNKESGRMDICDKICGDAFGIDVKPVVQEVVNGIINNPGSYYAHGRTGLIVVSPEKNLVVYFYSK